MADESGLPPENKLTRSKERWAREGKFLTGRIARPEDQRLPPGQHLTRDWPVQDLGLTPSVTSERWRLDVYGAVENPLFWDMPTFLAQEQRQFVSDIHCVTTWSRYDNQWEGLATRDLLAACRPRDTADFVVLHSYDGYTTNLALADFAAEDALLAHSWSGAPLTQEHAWPGARRRAASVFLEEREMAEGDRIPRSRCPRLLGSARLSQPRRSLGRAALFGLTGFAQRQANAVAGWAKTRSVVPTVFRRKAKKGGHASLCSRINRVRCKGPRATARYSALSPCGRGHLRPIQALGWVRGRSRRTALVATFPSPKGACGSVLHALSRKGRGRSHDPRADDLSGCYGLSFYELLSWGPTRLWSYPSVTEKINHGVHLRDGQDTEGLWVSSEAVRHPRRTDRKRSRRHSRPPRSQPRQASVRCTISASGRRHSL